MKIKKHQPAENEVDMTPMIDIVFQLIAFFMVITNFEQTQADERVKLPRDRLAKPPDAKRENEIVLNVGFERDLTGKKTDPTPYVFFIGERFTIDAKSVGPRLQVEQSYYKRLDVAIKDVTVIIRADSEVPTGLVQELIRMCQDSEKLKLEFEKFALKATERSQN